MKTFHLAAVLGLLSTSPAAAAFELSENYVPSAEFRPGYYICRTVYDLYSATWTFDLTAEGKYRVRSFPTKGLAEVAPDGTITFRSGFFEPDPGEHREAMNTTRVEDGKAVIILRSGHPADEFCAWIE